MTAGELHVGDTFVWMGARFSVVGFVNDADDEEQTHAGWIEAVYLQDTGGEARSGDMGIFPPDELVQLEEGHFPCEHCGQPVDEQGADCPACEDADEHDRYLHEISHQPARLG